MKYLNYLILSIFTGVLIGCANSHQIVRLGGDTNTKLDKNGAVYISVPRDGIYGNKNYRGSGVTTANIIQGAFIRRIRDVETGRDYESFNDALASAKKKNSRYLVYTTILQWEDRATEWSGKSDKVEIKIEIINVSDSSNIAGTIISGTSGLATFGGDHPQDLLPRPIEEYVSSLY